MSLTAGSRIGPYEIVAPIGAGGMGEVYRARDARLDRDVAVKILPDVFARDAERLTRFEREARTLASLNHPNIAHVYGIESLDRGRAIVMELVEGEDLAACLARGAIGIDDALGIARQMAEALEAAHERGIIHRDLKPANIKVNVDGVVKVLDFGLAKAIEGTESSVDPLNSPTMSMAGTRVGIILGTAAYMAPEQARGQTVDRRADIWAFGVVLFEMLSGKPAFRGETISDVLASVLKNDLDWRALPAELPPPILSLLRRCLNPDRKNRLRDIGEARIAISDYLADPAGKNQPGTGSRSSSRLQLVALGVTSAALVLALGMMAFRGRAPIMPSMRFVVSPPPGVSAHIVGRPSVALSPDGSTLAFVGVDKGIPNLYLRGPADFDARQIPGTEGAGSPEFSPGGRSIAFLTSSQLKTVALDGGVAEHGRANDPRGISWIDDATLIYTPESIGGLVEVSIKGGAPRALTTLDEKTGERTHRWPHALPGGEWVLFTVGMVGSPDGYDSSRIDAVSRRTGERRVVFQNASMARSTPTGHLLFARAGSLFAVPFDASALKVSGEPVSILQGIGGDLTTGAAHVTWSQTGTFAYVPADLRGGLRQLVWSDLKGTRQAIALPPALYNDIRLSPDGRRMAVAEGTSGLADIWSYAIDRGRYTRLTFTGANATPTWSADSRDVYYSAIDAGGGGGTTIFRTSADGGREPVKVLHLDVRLYLKQISGDGTWALVDFVAFGGARAGAGRLALKEGAKVEPLANTRADEYGTALSPDGRFIAYQSDESTRPEIYVRELGQARGRWQISNAGGEEPMWSPDGRTLYYRFEDRLMAVAIEKAPSFQFGLPAALFDGVYNLRSDTGVSYQPHPDGKRLIMTRPADLVSGGSVRVITRWFDELARIK